MENNKKNKTLLNSSRLYLSIPVGMLIAVLIVSISLIIAYAISNDKGLLIATVIVFGVFLLAYIAIGYLIIKKIHSVYYDQIFKVTYNNIQKLSKSDTKFNSYKNLEYEEIDELNDAMQDIKKRFANAYLVARDPNFNNLELDYVNKEKHLITFESFKSNLNNIIFLSQSFRNVLIEVYYFLPNQEMPEDEMERLINLYFQLFKDYPSILMMKGEGNKSLLIYLPVIDSFSRIQEQLESVMSDSSIVIRDIRGLEHVSARYAIVAYPYSTEDYLLSDLRYAKRQNKALNLFIPIRTQKNYEQNLLLSDSINLNFISKAFTKISSIEYSAIDDEKSKDTIKELFTDVSDFLSIDEAGIIVFDNVETLSYQSYIATDNSTIFKHTKHIDPSFVEALDKAKDADNSYYFSSRSHANDNLGRYLDFYGISSGYYQIVKVNDKINAIIYFFNRHKNLIINSYLRESFFVVGLTISHYFERKEVLSNLDREETEKENVLSINDYLAYRITDDFYLTYFSNDMKKVFPKVKVGERCYSCLHDLDRPCHDCPLKTFTKKEIQARKTTYIESLSLNDRKQRNRTLLLEKVHDEVQHKGDLFDKEFLTYTYFSFYNALRNEFFASGRGYVVLLTIDNYNSFIESQGNEGYKFALRCFIRSIKNKLKTNDVYMYNPLTLAIHFPYLGHADIINKCEILYELSKEHFFDDGTQDQFNITYLPVGYPRGYANVDDFIKHVSDSYHSDRYERNKDFIYFTDYSISRSASKRDFMVSVIENEFSSKSTNSVNLQPIVRVRDRHIYGAEILLRINDAHRNVFFNAEEISHIAEQENKTYLITESLINFIGNLYKEHGKSTFKNNQFNRIAINIDQTYLRDPNLIKGVINLCEANHLPNNFISFEVPEDIIPDNIDRIKAFAEELSNYHIFFSVDRFTGQYIGSEKLKDLGFNEIKIARNLIAKIDKDPIQLEAVKDIVNNAHKVGISVGAVGVENETQLKLLRDLDEDMMVQGYLLYKPLSRSDLISAIISYTK